jgi:predicted nuclease of predicted toxin-antitoxin system
MRLLIDECLHTSLVDVAHAAGFEAWHVNFLGLAGLKDWCLIEKVLENDLTLVTNNRTDFLKLYQRKELHAGLVILVPNVTPARQRELLSRVLAHIGVRQIVNAVIEVEILGVEIHCREYSWPGA